MSEAQSEVKKPPKTQKVTPTADVESDLDIKGLVGAEVEKAAEEAVEANPDFEHSSLKTLVHLVNKQKGHIKQVAQTLSEANDPYKKAGEGGAEVDSKKKEGGKSKGIKEKVSLTQVEANYRSSVISDTSYEVSVALPKGDTYFGHIQINLNIQDKKKLTKPLFIDYFGTKIQHLIMNDKEVTELHNTQYLQTSRIPLDTKMLKEGKN